MTEANIVTVCSDIYSNTIQHNYYHQIKMLVRTLRKWYSSGQILHPYLEKQLQQRNLLPLRKLQLASINLSSKFNNIFINQVDSAGKTLAFLLPVMNQLLLGKKSEGKQSGAIILTLSKELVLQIYTQIRQLDSQNLLKVKRLGSITHYSPVIDEMCKPVKDQNKDVIIELMNRNVQKSVPWGETDILITTPKILYRVLQYKADNKEEVTPQYLVLDEADVMLEDRDNFIYTNKCIGYIQHFMQKGANEGLKHIISAPDSEFFLNLPQSKLPKPSQFSFTDHTFSNSCLSSLKISYAKVEGEDRETILKNKIQLLLKIISDPSRGRVVIFCEKENLELIKTAVVTKTDIKTSEMYAGLSTEKRNLVLLNFREGASNFLIATDLISRGINLGKPVDTIISFDIEEPEDELSRICRSNKPNGQYIMLVGSPEIKKLTRLIDGRDLGQQRRYLQGRMEELVL